MLNRNKGMWVSEKIWEIGDLSVIEKLFLVKITGLDGEKGCYASNLYFSNFFNLSRSRCSTIINSLKSKGYIVIRYAYDQIRNLIERRVIKVKSEVVKVVKNTRNIMKRKGKAKVYLKSISKAILYEYLKVENLSDVKKENQIECLELSGTSITAGARRIIRTMRNSLIGNVNDVCNLGDIINTKELDTTSNIDCSTRENDIYEINVDNEPCESCQSCEANKTNKTNKSNKSNKSIKSCASFESSEPNVANESNVANGSNMVKETKERNNTEENKEIEGSKNNQDNEESKGIENIKENDDIKEENDDIKEENDDIKEENDIDAIVKEGIESRTSKINEISKTEVIKLDIFNTKKSTWSEKEKPKKSNQLYKEVSDRNKLNDKKDNHKESKKIIYEEIISYLNLKVKKSFRNNTVKTLKHINARLREGNTIEDFKKVIDKKCDEWLNTCMEEYLRPETLFGSKFERYLNENKHNTNFYSSNYKGGSSYGKQYKNARDNRENDQTKESTKFGIKTPLTREELERAEREIF